jgi:hypothetical protein
MKKLILAMVVGVALTSLLVVGRHPASAQNMSPVPGANGQFIQPNVNLLDDFCGNTPSVTATIGQLGWDKTVIVAGTNPVAAVASVANHPCLITLTTNTTATNGVGISLGNAVGTLFPGNSTNWQAEWIFEVNQIATGSYRVGFATVDSATAIPTNGVYIRFLQGTDTFINLCSDSASSETCGATTITPTAADYLHVTMSSGTVGNIVLKVQDVTTPAVSTITVCAAGCTVTATPPTVVLSPWFSIVETGGSVADIETVDFFGYQQIAAR